MPDIHGREFWKLPSYDEYDKIIFLGDYLDPYENIPFEKLKENLNEIIKFKLKNFKKVILLIGNHDWHYIGGIESTRKDYRNSGIYYNIFKEHLNLFNLCWVENNYIFTHAGITEEWKNECITKLNLPDSGILNFAKYLQYFSLNNYNVLSMLNYVSRYFRGGRDKFGSCLWADINEHIEYNSGTPLEYNDCIQIFGHTRIKKDIITDTWSCIDTAKPYIIDDSEHSI